MGNRIAFQTFGCKLNFAETSTIAREFAAGNYEVIDPHKTADIYVIHSCSVTAAAEKKVKAAIRRARKKNPNSRVVVMGCYAQLSSDQLKTEHGVDITLGNNEKFGLYGILSGTGANAEAPADEDLKRSRYFVPGFSLNDRTRTFFKVQDGCDYFCTFCAIPFARGRSRSAGVAETLEKVREIIDAGVKEIVLTGVNIGDFGKNTDEKFIDLLNGFLTIPDLPRLRISSIEPELLSHAIIDLVADHPQLMPHFHIPLQSGSDRILALMKRKYTRDVFADRVNYIKQRMPDACIAADVITGFPGETDEDFEDMHSFIESLPISVLHVFTYSKRPGTRAAIMPDQVSEEEKRRRSQLLHDLSDRKKMAFYTDNLGTVQNVLWESEVQDGYMFGFSENYIRCKTQYNKNLVNVIQPVTLTRIDDDLTVVTQPN